MQIQHLRSGGLSVERTAELSEVSARTVVRVSSEEEIEDPMGRDERAHGRVGRPSQVAEHSDRIRAWLEAEPDLASVAVLERLREQDYQGGKSAVYDSSSTVAVTSEGLNPHWRYREGRCSRDGARNVVPTRFAGLRGDACVA